MKRKLARFVLSFSALWLILVAMKVVAEPIENERYEMSNIIYCKSCEWNLFYPYKPYTVQCKNGQIATVSLWKKRDEWCVGTEQHQCSPNQLMTSNMACIQHIKQHKKNK